MSRKNNWGVRCMPRLQLTNCSSGRGWTGGGNILATLDRDQTQNMAAVCELEGRISPIPVENAARRNGMRRPEENCKTSIPRIQSSPLAGLAASDRIHDPGSALVRGGATSHQLLATNYLLTPRREQHLPHRRRHGSSPGRGPRPAAIRVHGTGEPHPRRKPH